jgi:hypothetical protein
MVDVTVRIECKRVIVAVPLGVVNSPDRKENGRVFGDEHALVPVILRSATRNASCNTIEELRRPPD